jgi:rubrerythrin
MSQVKNTAPLIGLLQLAYSGELAAAYAYRGHWKSVSDPEERHRIEEIEQDEWHHRKLVGEMLANLKAGVRLPYRRLAGADVWRGTFGKPQHSRV